jgi:hypothetical protein
MSDIEILQVVVGAAFVLLDGWNRFNDPVRRDSLATYRALQLDSRSSTTALSYYGALGLYLAALLLAFALLVMNKPWIDELLKNVGEAKPLDIGLPMLAALALIVVVPQVKPFSTLEGLLRGRLQSWASIPVEVTRFAHHLQGYEYLPPAGAKTRFLEIDGLQPTGDAGGPAEPLLPHLKATTLLAALETWKSSRIFGGFFAFNHGVHQQLQAEAAKLTRQIEFYREAVQKAGTETKTAHAQRESLEESAGELLRGVCYFIAAGVLRCCPLESARTRELASLGFIARRRREPILPGQVALALLAVNALVAVIQLLGTAKPTGAALLLSFKIASLYVSATLVAVSVWHLLRRPSSGRLRDRPYHQYLFAAGLAAGICMFLSLLFRLAQEKGDVLKALSETNSKLPYQLLTAAVAFGILFLLDNAQPAGRSDRKQRLFEGVALAALLGFLAVVVDSWLDSIPPAAGRGPRGTLDCVRLVVTGSAVGFLLGSCIPTWCRANQRVATVGDASEAPKLAPEALVGSPAR